MGLDDWVEGDKANSDQFSSSRSAYTGKRLAASRDRWVTKFDFSKPYLILAMDDQGRLIKGKKDLHIISDPDDPIRLDEHPNLTVEILVRFGTRQDWLKFCNLAQDQLGVDPNEVYEEDPERLVEIQDKVFYPPKAKPSKERTCQVCGKVSEEEGVTILELDLQENRRTPVCADHSIAELAEEGLLQ